MMQNKTFAIIGLGSFGLIVAKELIKLNQDIICIDKDEDAVARAGQFCQHAVVCDASDEQALRDAGLDTVDHAVVCVGEFDQTMILATLILKDIGVKTVTVKVKDEIQKRILEKIGADEVIVPESIIAKKIAKRIAARNIVDIIELDEDLSYVEFIVPKAFIGKSLNGLDFRRKFRLTVVAIRRNDILKLPKVDEGFQENDILLMIGKNSEIENFDKKISVNLDENK